MARQKYSGDGFGHSLTDLMTSIAVIFILLFLAFLQNERQGLAAVKEVTKTNRDELLIRLLEEFPEANLIKIQEDPDDPLTLQIVVTDNPDSLSFEFAEAELKPSGVSFLGGFIPKLAKVVCSPKSMAALDSIVVEGHTDSDGDDDLNTGLSASRATAVLIHSRRILSEASEQGDDTLDTLERCFLSLAQATGRGEQDSVPLENGDENKDASRRVIIKLRVKSLEQRETSNEVQEASVGG